MTCSESVFLTNDGAGSHNAL